MYTITNLVGTNITFAINFLSHYSMNKKEVQKGKKIEYFSLQLIIEPKSVMKLHNFILRDQLTKLNLFITVSMLSYLKAV